MRMQTFLIFCLPEVVYHSLTGHNRTFFFFFTSLKVASGLVWPDHATCAGSQSAGLIAHVPNRNIRPRRVRLLEIGDIQRV